jgi:hypothetical protein
MKIELKSLAPYLIMAVGFAASWGMWQQKVQALETKVDAVTQMQIDIAVIKSQLVDINKKLDNLSK